MDFHKFLNFKPELLNVTLTTLKNNHIFYSALGRNLGVSPEKANICGCKWGKFYLIRTTKMGFYGIYEFRRSFILKQEQTSKFC